MTDMPTARPSCFLVMRLERRTDGRTYYSPAGLGAAYSHSDIESARKEVAHRQARYPSSVFVIFERKEECVA